jgi:hypothetical protein
MSSFNITTPEASVNLRPSSVKRGVTAKGTATYSVTNRTGATVQTGLRIKPGEGTEESWFRVRDGDERDIAPGATESFSIDLAVPGGSAKHSFQVVAVNLADPDNDYEPGSAVAFDAPAVEPNGNGLKWWMIAAPVALLLVVGGVIAFFVFNGQDAPLVTLADFRNTATLEEAQKTLAEQGIATVETPLSEGAPEFDRQKFYDRMVVQQTPESDGTLEIPQSTTVELGWQWTPRKVTVPDVVNSAFGPAVTAIENAGLRYSGHTGPPGNQPSNLHYAAVAAVSPGGQQDAGTGITFTMTWREGRRLQDVAILQQQFELNRNKVQPAVEFRAIRLPPQEQ